MFDPSDHAGAPAEAPHVPGRGPKICRRCGGDAWWVVGAELISCPRCNGTGEDPNQLAIVLVMLVGAAMGVGFIWAIVHAVGALAS